MIAETISSVTYELRCQRRKCKSKVDEKSTINIFCFNSTCSFYLYMAVVSILMYLSLKLKKNVFGFSFGITFNEKKRKNNNKLQMTSDYHLIDIDL